MNASRWDRIGAAWLAGELSPANGLEEWRKAAHAEAVLIASILHKPGRMHQVATLVEVGCGVGRLTPLLAPYFQTIIATDTSSVMLGITSAAAFHWQNIKVVSGLYPNGDAALVWGNLYDEDWTTQAATEHLIGLCEQFPLVLAQTTRDEITNFVRDLWIEQGDDWMLLAGAPASDALV